MNKDNTQSILSCLRTWVHNVLVVSCATVTSLCRFSTLPSKRPLESVSCLVAVVLWGFLGCHTPLYILKVCVSVLRPLDTISSSSFHTFISEDNTVTQNGRKGNNTMFGGEWKIRKVLEKGASVRYTNRTWRTVVPPELHRPKEYTFGSWEVLPVLPSTVSTVLDPDRLTEKGDLSHVRPTPVGFKCPVPSSWMESNPPPSVINVTRNDTVSQLVEIPLN